MDLMDYLENDYLEGNVRVAPTPKHQAGSAVLVAQLLAAQAVGQDELSAKVDTISRGLIEPIGDAFIIGPQGDEAASRIAALIEALLEPAPRLRSVPDVE